MKTYKVSIQWMMTDTVEVQANSLDEAIDQVNGRCDLKGKGRYLEDSFEVNREVSINLSGMHECECHTGCTNEATQRLPGGEWLCNTCANTEDEDFHPTQEQLDEYGKE
jgi:ribosomal protein L37AE/L43A